MYTDATSILRQCQNEMKMGEMLKDENFTLEKAMSAMELMDPKMDSGMSDPPSKTLEETTFAYVFSISLSLSKFWRISGGIWLWESVTSFMWSQSISLYIYSFFLYIYTQMLNDCDAKSFCFDDFCFLSLTQFLLSLSMPLLYANVEWLESF